MSRHAALPRPAPLLGLLAVSMTLRLLAWEIDPERRLALPVSLIQGQQFWYLGDIIIFIILLGTGLLARRIAWANEWEDFLMLMFPMFLHLNLLLPLTKFGILHDLLALTAMTAYTLFLGQFCWRTGFIPGIACCVGLITLLAMGVEAVQENRLDLFGIYEQTVIVGLFLGFRWYDRVHLSKRIECESDPRRCRFANFRPPFL